MSEAFSKYFVNTLEAARLIRRYRLHALTKTAVDEHEGSSSHIERGTRAADVRGTAEQQPKGHALG